MDNSDMTTSTSGPAHFGRSLIEELLGGALINEIAFRLVDWPRILKPWKPPWQIHWSWGSDILDATPLTLAYLKSRFVGLSQQAKWKAEKRARDRLWLLRPAKMAWKSGMALLLAERRLTAEEFKAQYNYEP